MSATRMVWFLIGVASGAAFALLTAPASGQENRHWLLDKGLEGAGHLMGEERVEKGRRVAARTKEVAEVTRDGIDVVKRGRRLTRPIDKS